jgi:hypothetical protein
MRNAQPTPGTVIPSEAEGSAVAFRRVHPTNEWPLHLAPKTSPSLCSPPRTETEPSSPRPTPARLGGQNTVAPGVSLGGFSPVTQITSSKENHGVQFSLARHFTFAKAEPSGKDCRVRRALFFIHIR